MPLFSQGRFLILEEMETLRKRCTRNREATKDAMNFYEINFFLIRFRAFGLLQKISWIFASSREKFIFKI
jgi:hypothetical protein